jgi:hypothetical protein
MHGRWLLKFCATWRTHRCSWRTSLTRGQWYS